MPQSSTQVCPSDTCSIVLDPAALNLQSGRGPKLRTSLSLTEGPEGSLSSLSRYLEHDRCEEADIRLSNRLQTYAADVGR